MDNTTQEVEDFLRTHNIPFKALNHLPITTCEEGLKIAKEFGSTCCKTLLVKNKKQFFLFVIPGEERFNAKDESNSFCWTFCQQAQKNLRLAEVFLESFGLEGITRKIRQAACV